MIRCHLSDGEFVTRQPDDFSSVAETVNQNRRALRDMPLDAIIELLAKLGRKILQNPSINHLEGVGYISLWLRRKNLERICTTNYSDVRYLDSFVPIDSHVRMSAQPRGIVCQWVAANVPTLAFFSIAQTILSKNGCIAKIPDENKELMLSLFRELNGIEIVQNGTTYRGRDIVRAIALVSFEGRDHEISRQFSLVADCRVVYGGSEAVQLILALPCKEHCETIVFGPKYSFGVFDREYIESERFARALENTVKDIAIFNQMACSSPQVLFFEKSRYALREIGEMMKRSFEKLPASLLHQASEPGILANTINVRATYLLSDNKDIIAPDDLGWTILMDSDVRLEYPVRGKCIFIKEIDSVDTVLDLITRKVQAITLCIENKAKREKFAREATYRGVDRIVTPGTIHDYDHPWDGILPLNQLVRWVLLKDEA